MKRAVCAGPKRTCRAQPGGHPHAVAPGSRKPPRCRFRCWLAAQPVAVPSFAPRSVGLTIRTRHWGCSDSGVCGPRRPEAQLKLLRHEADEIMLTPVILPPGRLKLATSPALTGSLPATTTIGSVAVAPLAASGETVLPVAVITATWRRTRSDASDGRRS